jgi:hypothetical protein
LKSIRFLVAVAITSDGALCREIEPALHGPAHDAVSSLSEVSFQASARVTAAMRSAIGARGSEAPRKRAVHAAR